MYVRPVSINGPTAHLANRLVAHLPYPAGGRCVPMGRLLGPPQGMQDGHKKVTPALGWGGSCFSVYRLLRQEG